MAYVYRTVKIAGKTKLLHRHLMEQHLGRALTRSEHVHHINGDRHDNRMENLQVLSCAAHAHLHKQKHPIVKNCLICGAVFTPAPTKRARKDACSPKCGYRLGWIRRRRETLVPMAAALVRANCGGEHGALPVPVLWDEVAA